MEIDIDIYMLFSFHFSLHTVHISSVVEPLSIMLSNLAVNLRLSSYCSKVLSWTLLLMEE